MAGKRSFGSIRRLPSGRFQARYIHGADLAEHKAPTTFSAKIDAEGWLAEERRLIERGDWTPPAARAEAKAAGGLTLRIYAERWYSETVGRHKPSTRRLNKILLDRTILPGLGDHRLTALTASEVREWHASLEDYPTRNANAYSLLRTILAQAVDDEILEINPARVKRAAVKHRKGEPVTLTSDEIRALATAMPEHWGVLVLLGGFSGLRWGELTALRRSDLELAEDGLAVTVRRAVTYVNGDYVVGRPKSRAALRTVPLPEGLRPALVDHLTIYAAPGASGLVFPAKSGGPLSGNTIKSHLAKAAETIGRPGVTPHDLRHSAATLFAQAGATLADHMTLMGHTSAAMSARYTHSTESRTRGLVQGLWS